MASLQALKWMVRDAGQRYFPRTTLATLARRTWVLEPELALLPYLSVRKGLAIDAGANKGVYLYRMARIFGEVAGFEPNPSLASFLRRASPRNVTVYPVALSNTTGTAELSLPMGFIELGSLEPHSREMWTTDAPIVSHQVALERLDSYEFDDVALIKIDVEGHELALLQGARETIARWRPSVLVEIEERHAPGSLAAVLSYFEDLNYTGYYLDGPTVRTISSFDFLRDQNVAHLYKSVKVGRYINNFMFFDRRESAGIVAALCQILTAGQPHRRLRLRAQDAAR